MHILIIFCHLKHFGKLAFSESEMSHLFSHPSGLFATPPQITHITAGKVTSVVLNLDKLPCFLGIAQLTSTPSSPLTQSSLLPSLLTSHSNSCSSFPQLLCCCAHPRVVSSLPADLSSVPLRNSVYRVILTEGKTDSSSLLLCFQS